MTWLIVAAVYLALGFARAVQLEIQDPGSSTERVTAARALLWLPELALNTLAVAVIMTATFLEDAVEWVADQFVKWLGR